jgi:vacuolar-type H+-ATPase subunit I/STV1
MTVGTPLSRADSDVLARRRRGRNWMLLAVLIGVIALFYAITLVKIGQGTLKFG